MAITDIIEESSMIETGAPSIKYEGERPLKKQEMLMAGPDWYIKRMELLMDEYGYDYDEAGEIAYDSDKYYEVIGIDPGGIGDESRNMDQGIPNTKTIKDQPHMLAYITPGEADTLKDLGGQETMTPEGIPAYPPPGEYGGPGYTGSQSSNTNRERGMQKSAKENRAPAMSPGRSMAQFGHAGHAGKSENTAIKHQRQGRDVPSDAPSSAQNPYAGTDPTKIPAADKNRDGKIGPIESLNQSIIQRTTPYKKNKLRRLVDYIGKGRPFQMPGLFSVYDSLTGKYDLDESDYLGLENVSPGRLQAMFGTGPKSPVGTMDEEKIRNISKVLGQDTITQKEFEQFYPNMNPPPDRDGPDVPQDPCKGPNPPAYCFVGGKNQTDEEEEVVEEEWMMPLAFRAEGGRVGRAYGGIMGDDGRRAYGLGSIFKKIKKVFKSPLGKAALLGLGAYKMGLIGGEKNFKLMDMIMGKGGEGGLWNWAKDNPFAAISGASALSGLMAAKDYKKYDDWGDNDDGTGLGDLNQYRQYGIQAFAEGGKPEAGLMDMGGMEKDYREDGGFVPIGGKEKADDVPARLSKNEFVFTADAVRGAGDGDIDKGAEVMYNVMKNLEAGGDVSEETQGLDGAREMFQTSQRLEEVL